MDCQGPGTAAGDAHQKEFALPQYDAEILTGSKHLADVFEETVALCGRPKEVSNWLMTDAMRLLKEQEQDASALSFSPANLAKLIRLVEENVINRTVARTVFEEIFAHDIDPEAYVEAKGLKVVSDEGALQKVIQDLLAANPQSVADFKAGKEKAMGFIVGQTMRAMKGKADPAVVNKLVREMMAK